MAYGKCHSGKFRPVNYEKYKGDINNIQWRSSWELRFFRYCDKCSDVLEWASEEHIVPYKSPLDGKIHRYFIDVYVKIRRNGVVKKYLVEIKPHAQTKEPKIPKRRTKRYLNECKTFAVNSRKWAYAEKWAKKRGMEFIIMDEYDLGIKKRPKNMSK